MSDDDSILGFLCPEHDGSFTLEMFDQDGTWLMCLRHTPEKSMMKDFEEKIAQIPLDEFTPGWIETARSIVKKSMRRCRR